MLKFARGRVVQALDFVIATVVPVHPQNSEVMFDAAWIFACILKFSARICC